MSGEGISVIDMADRENTEETSSAGVENKGELPRETEAPVSDSTDTSVETQVKESSHSGNEAQNNVCVNGGDHEQSKADGFIKPDDELRDKILRQVEFYFSDANIVKDVFLLKHVRSSKTGFVNMNLIASFKRVKNLTPDQRVVAYSLRTSTELEVNDRGTKVRRIKPLPEYDEATPFRTVVAMNLAQKNPTVATVAEEFSQCAGVTLIRIIRPGQHVPPDVNKYANKHPEIGTAVCAVIEFRTEEQAKKVCKTMSNTEDWRNGRRVVLLASQKNNHKKQDGKVENGTEAETDTGKGTKKNKRRQKKTHAEENPADKNSCSSNSGSEGDVAGPSRPTNPSGDSKSYRSNSHSSPGSSPHTQHRCSYSGKPHQPDSRDTSSQNHRHGHGGAQNGRKMSPKTRDRNPGEGSSSSPWVQRRRQAAAQDGKAGDRPVSGHSRDEGSSTTSPRNSRLLNMVGILRQPKGPDTTRGFSGLGRGKPRCNTVG